MIYAAMTFLLIANESKLSLRCSAGESDMQ